MKTKKLYKYLLLYTFLFSGVSCTDLDESPVSILVPDQYFKTAADAEAAVMGIYSLLANADYYGRRLTMVLQLLGDDIDIADIGTQSSRIQINGFTHDASNQDVLAIWKTAYLGIGAANAAIDGIPNVEMDEQNKSALIAEARLLRALNYYHLVQLFGDIPYIGKYVADPSTVTDISKTPAAEVYEHIIDDCNFAIEKLPEMQPNDVRARPTKGSAHTLLASVYMILERWTDAATQAQTVINQSSKYNYALVDDYQKLWNADLGYQAEHVWVVDFAGTISGENSSNVDYTAPMTGVRDADMLGWSVLVPSEGMYTSFSDLDYRKKVSFLTETPIKGIMTPYQQWRWPRIHTAKWCLYPGSNASSEGSNSDIKHVIFRYAEVLLIAAEAINEANGGPTADAYKYINEVRGRARKTPQGPQTYPTDLQTGISQQDFRDAVREERRLELAFEWKRWYDLKRWKIVSDAFKQSDGYESHPNVQEYHTLLPIPQEEIGRNANLLPQNPGF
ncbi:MAG: RagB/SusD family nutrient uptake outer membrane protein [Sphingobacterium sp.]|uniref:RagB/SusD family nutrient uptake outer membrane protein n=1 Tax=Sphingobacterium sp. JB170 TaxID=1434842 RepID=UPI00097F30D9|nr:RagB/SusD family nutrient uptake outer membrane protein [Sphingobacterium sp. JB170]SJN35641.1 putative outer membrane protein, probably involved in nutrient binding [Sphingobacterium sp. JB170]